MLTTWGSHGDGPGQFRFPVRLCRSHDGHVFVAEYGGNDRVQKFTEDGDFVLEFGTFGDGEWQFERPSGVAWHDGRVYVSDAMAGRVLVFSDRGEPLERLPVAGVTLDLPYDVDVSPEGDLYLVEYGGGCLTALRADGSLIGRWLSVGQGADQIRTPWGLALCGDRIMVADTGNRRLLEVRL